MSSFRDQSSFYEFEHDNLIFVADKALEPLRGDEASVHEAFTKLSRKHIKAADGLLGLLSYDPEKFPAQRLDVVEVRSKERVDVDILEGFATAAYKGYPKLVKPFVSPAGHQLFSAVNEDIKRGEHYIFALDHGKIYNTPLAEIAALRGMTEAARRNKQDLPDFIPRLTISKLISRISALGSPAVNLLALPGLLDLSVPPSKTIREAGIDDGERHTFNLSVKAVREQSSEAGLPVVDFLSPSGTADVIKRKVSVHPRTVHMGPMSGGTADILCSARVVPIAANINTSRPRVALGTIHNPASSREAAQGIMLRLAELGKEATGIDHFYHQTRESFAKVANS